MDTALYPRAIFVHIARTGKESRLQLKNMSILAYTGYA
jgi:hypothetical protein